MNLNSIQSCLAAAVFAVSVLANTTVWGQEQKGAAFKVPQVGKPAAKLADYKPVVGRYGGRIVRDVLGEPKSFNPITAGETSTTDYTDRMFEGLTRTDAFTGEIVPLLAESFSVADDKVTWTFKLRKDVTFNDGTQLTAKDVEFTWNELIYDNKRPADAKDPRWPNSTRDIAKVDGKAIEVKAIDDYTVQVVTASPTALLSRWMSAPVLPEKVYGPSARDGTFGGKLGSDSKPEEIVSTGAWMLKEYLRGDRVVLKRNPKHWRKDTAGNTLPYLDEMVFRVAGNLNIMLLNFQQGTTDSYGLPSGREVPILRPKQEEGNFTLWQIGPDFGTMFMALNMNKDAAAKGRIPAYKVDWFRDVRFRRAVTHAVDRTALIRNVLRNMGHPLPAPFTVAPGPLTHEGFTAPEFNPELSKKLLAEMGFKPGPNGVLVDAEGRELAFSLTTNAGNTTRETYAEFIRKDLESIGMKVNFLPLEFNLLVDKMDNSQDWEAMIMGFTGGLEPNDGANFWRSNARLHLWWPNQPKPGFDWEARIDEIFDAGLKELDNDKRRAIYREWIEIVVREQPVVYLVVNERVAAVRNRFGNLFPSSAPTLPLFHNEHEIFVLEGK